MGYGSFIVKLGAVNTAPSSFNQMDSAGLYPSITNSVSLGKSGNYWQSVYASGYLGGGYGGVAPWSITSNGSDIFLNTGTTSSSITLRPNGPGSTTGEVSIVPTLMTIGPAVKLGAANFTPNGSTSISLTALAPSGAHATVQEWLTIQDASGTVRYIPCF